MKCLIESCVRPVKARGLCDACYQAARNMVIAGKITWEDLEKRGLVKKPSTAGGWIRGPFASEFNNEKILNRCKEFAAAQEKLLENNNEVPNA